MLLFFCQTDSRKQITLGVRSKYCRFNPLSTNLKGLRESLPDFLVEILASQQNFDYLPVLKKWKKRLRGLAFLVQCEVEAQAINNIVN